MPQVRTIPFAQGNAPMPNGCVCDPMDYAALGHMTTCPCRASVAADKIANQSLYGKIEIPYDEEYVKSVTSGSTIPI